MTGVRQGSTSLPALDALLLSPLLTASRLQNLQERSHSLCWLCLHGLHECHKSGLRCWHT